MYNDLAYALSLLRHRYSLLVLGVSAVATLAFFAGAAKAAIWLIGTLPYIPQGWVQTLAEYAGGFLVLLIGWLVFPAVMVAMACLVVDGLIDRAERAVYGPALKVRPGDWGDALSLTLSALWHTALYNLLALPFYFIPGVNIAAYLAVNGWLLVREYFFVIALRHMTLPEAESLFKAQRWPLFRTGVQMAALFLVPIVNLFAPILAAGILIHRLEGRPDGVLRPVLARRLAL